MSKLTSVELSAECVELLPQRETLATTVALDHFNPTQWLIIDNVHTGNGDVYIFVDQSATDNATVDADGGDD